MRALLFALTRQQFDIEDRRRAEHLCTREEIDWTSFLEAAAAEGVAPVVGVNLAACDASITRVSRAVTARFEQVLFENAALKAQRRMEFAGQMASLDARGYDVMLLKSMALEATGVYRQPWVTAARDVDIALRQRTPDRVSADDSPFRQSINDLGVETEHPSGHHDLSLGGVIDLHFDELWPAARAVAVEGLPVPAYVLGPEDTLFVLCLNACRKGFFRLKTLFDIRETIAGNGDLDWPRFVARMARSNAGGVAYTALRVTARTVGLPDASLPGRLGLVSPGRAIALDAAIAVACRLERWQRAARLALQIASLTGSQQWRNAKVSLFPPVEPRSAVECAAALLPGQS